MYIFRYVYITLFIVKRPFLVFMKFGSIDKNPTLMVLLRPAASLLKSICHHLVITDF